MNYFITYYRYYVFQKFQCFKLSRIQKLKVENYQNYKFQPFQHFMFALLKKTKFPKSPHHHLLIHCYNKSKLKSNSIMSSICSPFDSMLKIYVQWLLLLHWLLLKLHSPHQWLCLFVIHVHLVLNKYG